MLQILFPVAYWDLIRTHAPAQNLDPYLVAALMAQESTFDAGIVSHANAIGLMQIVPSTGRSYARRLRIPRFSKSRLTDPATNVKIGTAYFADLVDRFGGVPYALASYNAGPGAVARWKAERPGIARTSSSTTSRIRRRRTTSGRSSAPPKTTAASTASSASSRSRGRARHRAPRVMTAAAPSKQVKPQRTSIVEKEEARPAHRHRPR